MSLLVEIAQYPILETERLLLRPMTPADLEDYHAFTSDDENLRFAFFPHKNLKESLESLVLYNLQAPIGKYGIVEKESQRLIGNISLKVTAESKESLEIGYTLHGDYAGRGYMTEAVSALIHLARKIQGLQFLTATTDIRNLASQRVLEKSGMSVVAEKPATSLRGEDTTYLYYSLAVS